MALRTIVVGVDDSPGSREALRFAAELAEQTGARLVSVHCFQPLDHLAELTPGVDLRALRERATRTVETRMCGPLVERGLACTSTTREGDPADVLLAAADEVGADLLVVGSRRLGLLERLTLGSTSTRLLRLARRPVAVVPLPPA